MTREFCVSAGCRRLAAFPPPPPSLLLLLLLYLLLSNPILPMYLPFRLTVRVKIVQPTSESPQLPSN
jgi:hypothetical protein